MSIAINTNVKIELDENKINSIYENILKNYDTYFLEFKIISKLYEKYKLFCKQPKCTAHNAFLKSIQYGIALLDTILNKQINKIMHHQDFQRLEASWRGLEYLVNKGQSVRKLKIKVLTANWDLLAKDLKFALDFDQSQLFKKIYTQEFDRPGGEPFGLLIGDYYIDHQKISKDGINYIDTFQSIARVAAAAFAPFITAASSKLLELDHFANLQPWLDLARTFEQEEYRKIKQFRTDEDARFVGMVMPRVLMRLPNFLDKIKFQDFCFNEESIAHEDYLWGNAAYYLAAIIIRAYSISGWFNDIRGVEKDNNAKGLVSDLCQQTFSLDRLGFFNTPGLECWISGSQEQILSGAGLIPLSGCKYSANAAFYSCQSIQRPKIFDREDATANAVLSSKLDHILCVSRFAHYIKVIIRDKIGSFQNAEECERYLQQWLIGYTAVIDELSLEQKMKYPLHGATVQVREQVGKPGNYVCLLYLLPHYQIDEVELNINLATEITL